MFPNNLVEAAYTGFRSKEQKAYYNKTETLMLNSTDNETMYASDAGRVYGVDIHFINDTAVNVTRSELSN
ncbi:hypothetical protein ACF0H5_018126 [Mactra antiquata]